MKIQTILYNEVFSSATDDVIKDLTVKIAVDKFANFINNRHEFNYNHLAEVTEIPTRVHDLLDVCLKNAISCIVMEYLQDEDCKLRVKETIENIITKNEVKK